MSETENARKQLRTKFYFLCACGVLIVVSFFLYAQFTHSWGKKFSELGTVHVVIQILYGIVTVCYIYVLFRFVKRHPSIAKKKDPPEPKAEEW